MNARLDILLTQKAFLLLCCICTTEHLFSQNIAINTTGAGAAATNMFEVTQTSTAANMVAMYAIHNGANAAGQTGYGFQAIKTGATGNNVAGYFSASGGANNYALLVPSGGGFVGIGTSTPSRTLQVEGSGAGVHTSSFLNTTGYGLALGSTTGSVFGSVQAYNSATSLAVPLAFQSALGGNVGIGTFTPDGALQVASITGIGRQIIAGGPTVYPKGWADMSSNVSGDGVFGGNMYTDWNPATYRYSDTHGSIGAMGFAVNYPGDSQASVITSGTTSSTAGTSFTPTAIAVFDYSGKVSIGTTSLASRLYVRDNTLRQIAAYDWLDMSSTGGGYGMVGGNAYMNWSDNTFRYAQTHGAIGGIGLVTNYPSWNQTSIFSSGTTSSTGGNSFTPTLIAVFDYAGKVGIGTPSPATKLDVQGTSGTTLKIVDGNQAAGKVLTSDAAGVASWANGPTVAGSGFIRLIYNDETDNSYGGTTANIRTYALAANTYSQIMVEADVVTSGIFTYTLNYNGTPVQTTTLGGSGAAIGAVIKYSAAATAAQTISLDITRTAGTPAAVTGFRVYGIY